MSANSLQHRITMTLLLVYRPYYFKHEIEKDEVILTQFLQFAGIYN